MRRRILRIFPPYWASLALMLALAAGTWLVTGVNDVTPLPRSTTAIMANLTLTTDPVTSAKTINWVYWSLSYELAFYVIMAAVLAVAGANRIRLLVAVHFLICGIGAMVSIATPSPWFFIRLWPLFGIGIAICLVKAHRTEAVVMLGACALNALGCIFRQEPLQYSFVAWGAAALVWSAPQLSGIGARILTWAGESSYSLYLIHVPIGCFLVLRLVPMPADQPLFFFASQSFVLLACLLAARVFFRCFERPFMREVTTASALETRTL